MCTWLTIQRDETTCLKTNSHWWWNAGEPPDAVECARVQRRWDVRRGRDATPSPGNRRADRPRRVCWKCQHCTNTIFHRDVGKRTERSVLKVQQSQSRCVLPSLLSRELPSLLHSAHRTGRVYFQTPSWKKRKYLEGYERITFVWTFHIVTWNMDDYHVKKFHETTTLRSQSQSEFHKIIW